jgi:hypothetical protein
MMHFKIVCNAFNCQNDAVSDPKYNFQRPHFLIFQDSIIEMIYTTFKTSLSG